LAHNLPSRELSRFNRDRSREAFPGKDGETYVKYFKITKTWAVKAESETEAINLVKASPEDYLDQESVTRTEYKRPQQKAGGWTNGFKEQLLGANSKR
jgi:hypothetical protein